MEDAPQPLKACYGFAIVFGALNQRQARFEKEADRLIRLRHARIFQI
jgi:hypothetical protein